MLEMASKTSWYLYSFWNPKRSLKHEIDTIVSEHSHNNFRDVKNWNSIYQCLEQLDDEGIRVIADNLPNQEFWTLFGKSQNFPMGENEYWQDDPKKHKFISKKYEFAAYFKVMQSEKKLDKDSLNTFLKRGVVRIEHDGIMLSPMTLIEPTHTVTYMYGTEKAHHYWVELIRSHWDKKIDEALLAYENSMSISKETGNKVLFPLSHYTILDTLEHSLSRKNYYAFSKLIETMLRYYKQNETTKTAEKYVCEYNTMPKVLEPRSLWQTIVKDYEDSYDKDPKFLEALAKLIPSKRLDVHKLITKQQDQHQFKHYNLRK